MFSLSSQAASLRYPKRKRTEVNYYYSDSESDAIENSNSDIVSIKKIRTTKKPSRPLPKHKVFPFLSLPPEIRNKIYYECLLDSNLNSSGDEHLGLWVQSKQRSYRRGVERTYPKLDDWDESSHGSCCAKHYRGWYSNDDDDSTNQCEQPPLVLDLLTACQQIYAEASPILYSQRLVFLDVNALSSFASGLSSRTAPLLRHIEIRCWNLTRSRKSNGFMAMSLLAAKGATNIEKLNINCEVGYFGTYRQWARSGRKYSEDEPLKRAGRKVFRDCYPWLDAMKANAIEANGLDSGICAIQLSGKNFREWFSNQPEEEHEALCKANNTMKKELRRLMSLTY